MIAHLFITAAFAFSFLQGAGAVSSSSGLDTVKRFPDSRPLFPLSRKALSLRSRDLVRRGLHPRDEVVLSYGEDFHELQKNIFVVDITFIAHEALPIVLLEDFEELASSIICADESIIITFSNNFDFEYTRDAWGPLDTFILISSHYLSGCNLDDEHGAYLVKHTNWDKPSSTVEISAGSLPLVDAARRMSVDFGHISRDEFHRVLTKRQTTAQEIADNQNDGTLDFHFNETMSIKKDFAPREALPLSPNVPGGSNDSSTTNITITCVGCAVDGELTVRGRFDQVILPEPRVQWAWVEAEATKAITTKLQLEFFLDSQATKEEWAINFVPSVIFIPFSVGGIFTIGPSFEYNLIVGLDLSPVKFNFTYGIDIDVPVNSIARFDIKNNSASFARGWNKTKVTEMPFTINELSKNVEIGVNVTAQPKIGFKIEFLLGTTQAGPTLDFDAPKLMFTAKELEKVNSNCSIPSSSDRVYDTALQLSTNWELGVNASLSAELELPKPFDTVGGSASLLLYSHAGTPVLTCKTLGGSSIAVGEKSGFNKKSQGGLWVLVFLTLAVAVL